MLQSNRKQRIYLLPITQEVYLKILVRAMEWQVQRSLFFDRMLLVQEFLQDASAGWNADMSNNRKYCIVRLRHNYDSESLEYKLLSTSDSIESASDFIHAHDFISNSSLEDGDMVAVCEMEYVANIIGCEDVLYVMCRGFLHLAPEDIGREYYQCSWLDVWYGENADSAAMISIATEVSLISASKLFSAAFECVNLVSKHMRAYASEHLKDLERKVMLGENINLYPMDMIKVPSIKDGSFYRDHYTIHHAEESVWYLSRRNFLEAVKSAAHSMSEAEDYSGNGSSYKKYLELAPIIRKHISLAEIIANRKCI